MKETLVATAEDFRLAAEARPPECVTLPSGKTVLLRRPTPIWFMLSWGRLPKGLAAHVEHGGGSTVASNVDDLSNLANYVVKLITEIFVQPRVSLTPGPDEISPDLISDEDIRFLIRWAAGEVVSTGKAAPPPYADLASFRGERGSATGGAGSGDVGLPS